MHSPTDVLPLACSTSPILLPSLIIQARRARTYVTCSASFRSTDTLPVATAGVRGVGARVFCLEARRADRFRRMRGWERERRLRVVVVSTLGDLVRLRLKRENGYVQVVP